MLDYLDTSQGRGTARTLPNQLFVLFYVLFLCKRVLYYCHQMSTQLQLTNVSYHESNKNAEIEKKLTPYHKQLQAEQLISMG